jgi:HlyD family secretion protein
MGLAMLFWWAPWRVSGVPAGFVTGNGRIEATEIAVASRFAGRLQELLVGEGDFVRAGQPLARLQVDSLLAQQDEAQARLQQARQSVAAAEVQVAQAESGHQAALALVVQRESELDSARRRLPRSEQLAREGFFSVQLLDDDRAKVRNQQAILAAAQAQARAAAEAVKAARAQVAAAGSNVRALEATLARIRVDLADAELKAPRDGRVQVLVAQPGEIVAGGGRVLELADLSDVYMSFFLPETVAGRVALGSEVRIVLDAAPDYPVPARVSFVASQAQFTPKTVETASERQKLMFRVRARVDRELLLRHLEQVKTGLPGVAWVRLDPQAAWPAALALRELP